MRAIKKKHHKGFNLFHYILILFVIAIGFFGLVVVGNLATYYIRTNRPVATTQTTTEPVQVINLEAVILETKGKLLQANAYIRITDGSTTTIGSAVIIDSDDLYYYAITNQHVIEGSESLTKTVATYDLISTDFTVIATSEELDLAIIQFDKSGRSNIVPLSISGEEIPTNEFVMAVGNPIGSVGSVTIGVIQEHVTIRSDLDIEHDALLHTATLGNGSSGGALVDMYGNLIGLNSWGIGGSFYAIPSTIVLSFIESQILF